MFQLGFGRSPIHKLQNRAQIANIDASLVQGLGQRGSIHGQSAVIQTVFNLVMKHMRGFKFRSKARKLSACMIWICGRVCATDQRWDLTGHQEGSSVFEKLLLLLDVICAVVWETNPWFNNTHTYTVTSALIFSYKHAYTYKHSI